MSVAIRVPRIGVEDSDVMIVEWLKADGDPIEAGEIIAILETDKITYELEAPASGILRITVEAGNSVPMVAEIGYVEGAEGGAPAAATESPAAEPAPAEAPATGPGQAEPEPTPAEAPAAARTTGGTTLQPGRPLATPSVRRMARSLGVDLSAAAATLARQQVSAEDLQLLATGQPVPAPAAPAAGNGPAGKILASPKARRLAREMGVPLEGIQGSAPGGAILAADVERAASEAAARPAAPTAVQPAAAQPAVEQPAPADHPALAGPERELVRRPASPMRRTIASNMMQSLEETAQMTLMGDLDAGPLYEFMQTLRAQADHLGYKPSYAAIMVKAVAIALESHPMLRTILDGDELVEMPPGDIGVAVALDRGLVVPVIRDADSKSLSRIHRELADLAERARAGQLSPEEMVGGSFTITNLGSFGGEWGTPILNRRQSGILGMGRTEKVPVVDDQDRIVVGYRMRYSLTVDHRVVDGAVAGAFVQELRRVLLNPLSLL